MSFHIIETDVRRVWAALRFVDAMSGQTLESPLHVEIPGSQLRRNRSGLFVLFALDQPEDDLDALRDYENAFDPMPAVPAQSLQGTVADPAGRYLTRRFSLALPRSPAPAAPGARAPLFEAAPVTLDPAPATPLLPTWAALRLSVRRAGAPAAQAAIRVRRPGGAVLGRSMTDARGEALVAVVGVAQVTPGAEDLVVEREIAVEIVISADTALAPGAIVDPDLLAARANGAAQLSRLVVPRNLATGRIEVMNLTLP